MKEPKWTARYVTNQIDRALLELKYGAKDVPFERTEAGKAVKYAVFDPESGEELGTIVVSPSTLTFDRAKVQLWCTTGLTGHASLTGITELVRQLSRGLVYNPAPSRGEQEREEQFVELCAAVFALLGNELWFDKILHGELLSNIGPKVDISRGASRGNERQESTEPAGTGQMKKLADVLKSRFNDEELRSLCFSLEDIDYDNLPGETKDRRVEELVAHYNRRNQLSRLKETIRERRPDITFD